ncbi:MAG: hypothetical protein BMS9Abin18_1057 [Zetaproteobacteria bacterium]|nr:MAG: hypothetical protein BMS9Abin18_1057 [Zetaproteobacteria bacterium]
MSDLIRFSFPLSPRMQTFLQLRDGLSCLAEAEREGQAYKWLQACADVRISLSGEQGRRPALPEVIGLLAAMQTHLESLAEEHPRFRDKIMDSCETLGKHVQTLRCGMDSASRMLASDALIEVWLNALKKHDWLGHQRNLPQALPLLWQSTERRQHLHEHLQELFEVVMSLHAMLHDYVEWERRLATEGSDQILPDRSTQFGLVIVGLAPEQVEAGIIPDISGNRLAIRIRFQSWLPGHAATPVQTDVPYHAMLVPIA